MEQDRNGTTTFSDVVADEAKIIERRRDRLYPGRQDTDIRTNLVGVALSGGGIRSAVTNLGVLYEMSRVGLFKSVDYLSTVSGGGYIGCCLASLLSLKQPIEDTDQTGKRQGTTIYNFGNGGDEPGLFSEDWSSFPFRDLPLSKKKRPATTTTDQIGDVPQHCNDFSSHDQVYHLRDRASYLLPRTLPFGTHTIRMIGATLSSTLLSLLWFLGLILLGSSMYMLATMPQWQAEFSSQLNDDTEHYSRTIQLGKTAPFEVTFSKTNSIKDRTKLTDRALASLQSINVRIVHQVTSFFKGPEQITAIALITLAGLSCGFAAPFWGRRVRSRLNRHHPETETTEDLESYTARMMLMFITGITIFLFSLMLAVISVWTFIDPPLYLPDKRLLFLPWLAGSLFFGSLIHYSMLTCECDLTGKKKPAEESCWNRIGRSDIAMWTGVFVYTVLATLILAVLPAFIAIGNLEYITLVLGLLVLGLQRYFSNFNASRKNGPEKGFSSLLTKIIDWFIGLLVPFFILLSIIGISCLLRDIIATVAIEIGQDHLGVLIPVVVLFPAFAFGLLISYILSNLNFNRISPHIFYKDRLAEAFLQTYRLATQEHNKSSPQAGTSMARNSVEMNLMDLHGNINNDNDGSAAKCAAHGPYLLINATLNLTAARDLKGFRRQSTGFLFSRCYTGSDRTGYVPTSCYDEPNLQLGRVMAVSGAAVTSVRGAGGTMAESFACTIFGVRLGYWLRHPEKMLRAPKPPLWHWHNLLNELFRYTNARNNHVYLSDGGHCGDNLGLLPLLKRRLKFIIASDAECDPEHLFNSLNNSIRRAYVDENIKVSICLDDLEPDIDGFTHKHYTIGRIFYPDRPWQKSWLLVIKNTMTGGESSPIRNYKKKSPEFPHETTADQFFSEEQFEAYRSLGREACAEIWDKCREVFSSTEWLQNPWSCLDHFCETLDKSCCHERTQRKGKECPENEQDNSWDDIIRAIWKCETGDFSTWQGFLATIRDCFESLPTTEQEAPSFQVASQLHQLISWLEKHQPALEKFNSEHPTPRSWEQFLLIQQKVAGGK